MMKKDLPVCDQYGIEKVGENRVMCVQGIGEQDIKSLWQTY